MSCMSESFVPYVKFPSRIRRCPVNPTAYKEVPASKVTRTEKPKKVLVMGGGPAGMEAATILAERGHDVVLCEKSDRLGGKLHYGQYVYFKGMQKKFLATLINRLNRSGAQVLLNTPASDELVAQVKPDVIVAAMGAEPVKPDFAVEGAPQIIMALDAYGKLDTAGENVVVVGGGLVGCELSLLLAKKGKRVTLLERKHELCRDAAYLYREGLLMEMEDAGVEVRTDTNCLSVREGSVEAEGPDGKLTIAADTVIAATGFACLDDEAEHFRSQAFDFWKIGDNFQVRKIFNAMREGYNAGAHI